MNENTGNVDRAAAGHTIMTHKQCSGIIRINHLWSDVVVAENK